MRRFLATLTDAFFLMRPLILVPVWGFSFLGYARAVAVSRTSPPIIVLPLSTWGAVAWVLVFSLSVGAVYVLNQLADLDADRNNDGFALLAKGVGGKPLAIRTALFCAVLSVGIPLIGGKPPLAVFSALALVVGILYSFKPTRFSGRPVLDFLSNGLGYGAIAFGAGWYLGQGAGQWYWCCLSAVPYVLLMCGGSISSTVGDIQGDRADNKITTAVMLGPRKSQMLALVCILLGGTTGFFLAGDIVAVTVASMVAPLYVYSLIKNDSRSIEASYKIGGASMMLVAAVRVPALAILGVGIILLTRIYFGVRHGIAYPSLGPAHPIR